MRDDKNDRHGSDGGPSARLLEPAPGALDEDAAWALDLLRQAPPHRPRAGERQRVLLGLRRPRASARHAWAIRWAAVAAALIAATTIARAGLGHLPRWLAALAPQRPVETESQAHPKSGVIRHAPPPATTPAPAPPAAPPLEPDTAQPFEPEPEPRFAAPPQATGGAPRPSRPRLAAIDRRDRDSGLVVQAMRALRRDGDPALARALSATYLERHPDGALAEEALALIIEAAVAHPDADARALGARYLRQYPNGPFRGLARQAGRTPAAGGR